jgi:hypothetical protein
MVMTGVSVRPNVVQVSVLLTLDWEPRGWVRRHSKQVCRTRLSLLLWTPLAGRQIEQSWASAAEPGAPSTTIVSAC